MIKVTGIDSVLKQIRKESEEEILNQENKIKNTLVQDLKAATPVDTGKARSGWKKTDFGIENPVDYISELNSGSSAQAPSFFVERTILSHPGVSPSGIIVVNK
jgi:hypothetical protein